jgi:hypothetical protein
MVGTSPSSRCAMQSGTILLFQMLRLNFTEGASIGGAMLVLFVKIQGVPFGTLHKFLVEV